MEKEPINKPFADLPVFVKAHKIHLKVLAKAAIPINISDDSSLLIEAMQGVKTIDENKKRIIIKRTVMHFGQTSQDNNPQKLL